MESEKHAWNDFDSCNYLRIISSVSLGNSKFNKKQMVEFFFAFFSFSYVVIKEQLVYLSAMWY